MIVYVLCRALPNERSVLPLEAVTATCRDKAVDVVGAVGLSIGELRAKVQEDLGLLADDVAFVGQKEVSDEYVVKAGDVISFRRKE